MPRYTLEILVKGKDAASGPLGKVGGALGSLGKIAVVGSGAAVGAIGGLGLALGKLAADAAPLEGIRNAFEGLTKSMAGGSERMLASLEDASAGMIAQRDLMKSFNLAAQLVSKDFATQLPDAMGYLSKVAAATGQDMDYMMDSLVRGVGRLSPLILDNLGIQVDMNQAIEEWAKAGGKALAPIVDNTEAMQDQRAAIEQLKNQLMVAQQRQMEFTDSTAASTRATNRFKIEELTQKIADHQAELMGLSAAHGQASTSIKDLTANMTKAQQQEALMAHVMKLLAENTAEMPDVAGSATAQMAALGATFQNVKDTLGTALLPIFTQLLTKVAELAEQYLPVLIDAFQTRFVPFLENKVIPLFGKIFNWLATNLPIAFGVVSEAVQTLANFWTTTLQPAITKAWTFISANLMPILSGLAAIVLAVVVPAFAAWAIGAASAAAATIAALAPVVVPLLAIGAAVALLVKAWQENWMNIREIFRVISEEIVERVKLAWDIIKSTITSVMEIVRGTVKMFMQIIRGDWSGAWQSLKNILDIVMQAVWKLIDNAMIVVISILKALLGRAWRAVMDAGRNILEAFRNAFVGAYNAVRDWLGRAWENIQDFIRNLYEAGKNIVQSIWNGIQAAWGNFIRWFKDRLRDLTSLLPFSEPQDASSPFYGLSESGKAIAANLLSGLRAGLPAVQAELGRLTMPGVGAIAGAAAGGGGEVHYLTIYGGLTVAGVSDAGGLFEELRPFMP